MSKRQRATHMRKGAHRGDEETRDFIFRAVFFNRTRRVWRFKKRCMADSHIVEVTCIGARTRAEANEHRKGAIAEQRLAELKHTAPSPDDDNRTFAELLAEWCDVLASEHRASTHRDFEKLCKPVSAKRAAFKKGEAPKFQDGLYVRTFSEMGRTFPKDVTFADLERLLKITWSHLSGRTLVKHYYNLRAFFEWCLNRQALAKNPIAPFKIPKKWRKDMQRAAKNTGQILEYDEARRLLIACREKFSITLRETAGTHRALGREWQQAISPPAHLYSIVLTAFLSGLRLGNITGMKWHNLNLADGMFHFPAAAMKNDEPLDVPMHEELREHFRAVLAERTNELGHAPSPDAFVLGVRLFELRFAFTSALIRAGLYNRERPFRLHDCRHSFSTWLHREKEADAAEYLLGHKLNSNDVTRRYVHLTEEDLRAAVNKLPVLGVTADAVIEGAGAET